MKKAILYSPYLDSLGGGERYMLTVASLLSKNNYQVDFIWKGKPEYIKKAQENFNLNLSKINFLRLDFASLNLFRRLIMMRKYDLSFFLSDGSIPFLFAKKNLLHVQVPFNLNQQNTYLIKLKLALIDKLVCNSNFTKKWTEKTYHTSKTAVLYPPVDTHLFKHSLKNFNQILSVSRFSTSLNNKRQDILIDAFKKLFANNNTYKLVLAGSSSDNNPIINNLKSKAKGLPVTFILNPNIEKLKDLYSESKFFWHAAGFGIDQDLNPQSTEHFGIVLVEALSSGCIVFAVDKGGAREIIQDGKNGYLYTTVDALVSKTLGHKKFLKKTNSSINKFSISMFKSNLLKLIN